MLGISTGSVWRISGSGNINGALGLIQSLSIDFRAIEVLLPENINGSLELSLLDLTYLNSRDWVSVHLCDDQDHFKNALQVASRLHARRYIMHPLFTYYNDSLQNKIIIENMDNSHKQTYFKELTDTYDICLDVSHGLSKSNLEWLIRIYHSKIKVIHMSNYNPEDEYSHKCHACFHKDKTDPKNEKIQWISHLLAKYNLLGLPIIMEYNFSSLRELVDEYNYLMEFL